MQRHRAILAIALPMVLANLSVPMLGFVDTTILGHLESAETMAAVSLGSYLLSLVFWSFGFLRMSTTGITSRALGAENSIEVEASLYRALLCALAIALLILPLGMTLLPAIASVLAKDADISDLTAQYLAIRIWAAPATLATYAAIGWLIGLGASRGAMLVLIGINVANALLDYLFMVQWGWGLCGAAWASLAAEYLGVLIAAAVTFHHLTGKALGEKFAARLFDPSRLAEMLQANGDIFIRTLCLLLVFLTTATVGVRLGPQVAAANAILLNLLAFAAYFMDGFAYAAESLGGRAWGQRNRPELLRVIWISSYMALLAAAAFSLTFATFGIELVQLYTDLPEVVAQARQVLPWLVWLPLAAIWCYQLDGIFIGIGHTATLRNTMLLSLGVYVATLWLQRENLTASGLWLAFWLFHLMRGMTLGLPLLMLLRRTIKRVDASNTRA